MFGSFRVTREQALNNHELVNGKRGAAPELAAEVAAKASKSWGQRLKGWALNLLVGGVAASAGTAIYGKVNPNSSALGGGESKSTSNAPTTAGSPTASPGPATGSGTATGPGPATGSGYTTGPGYVTGSGYTTGPGYATGSGYTATGYPPAVSPSTSGTTTATRAIAERAREGRALDRKFSADISSESSIPSYACTVLLIVSSLPRSQIQF